MLFFFTLDTGRLLQKTHDTPAKREIHFKIKIHIFSLDSKTVEEMVNTHGINLFDKSQGFRKFYGKIRKTNALVRALAGKKGWFTGLRVEQTVTRIKTPIIDWDRNNNMYKFSLQANSLEREVLGKFESPSIPYNYLLKQGYQSLGYAPCTRPIGPEDDFRTGCLWWEEPESRDYGLYVKKI
jgi:phosphoadenosine phosphosulfate reductase